VKEDVRLRAMRWLLVLDYVESEAAAHGGLEAAVAAGVVLEDPWEVVRRVGDMAPHKICQFAFKRNDIVWICKDCQRDESAWVGACLLIFLAVVLLAARVVVCTNNDDDRVHPNHGGV
jgi:hypothetical protein